MERDSIRGMQYDLLLAGAYILPGSGVIPFSRLPSGRNYGLSEELWFLGGYHVVGELLSDRDAVF